VLAAGRISPDGTGLHIRRAIKSGFDTVSASFVQHLGGSITDGYRFDINLRFGGAHFYFSHLLPP
jgi:hypothetical protein